jgi:Prokaryotic lipoprotein-attachment site
LTGAPSTGDQHGGANKSESSPVIRFTLACAIACAALSACGLRGDLERPVPLWGNPPNEGPTDPRTIKAAEEAAAAEKARQAAEREAARQEQETQPAAPAQPN